MKVYQIGIISFENEETERELKAIGGIQGYLTELISFLLSKDIVTGFIGKIYNFRKTKRLKYYQIQNNITSTNIFLIFLFVKSLFIKLPKDTIIHAHRPDHFTAFAFTKNKPSVISLHGQIRLTIYERKGVIVRTIYNVLEMYALKKTNAIIPVDEITKAYYLKLYPQYEAKIKLIPTGVNIKMFKPLDKQKMRNKLGFSESDKIIIYVGRIEPPKKIEDIVNAFETLVKQDKSYKLVIVGDGVLFNEIKSLSKRLELDKFITFLGVRKRNELPEIFNIADISVLYSKNEGSPLSIKESLACGIPVVANCVGDIAMVVKNDYNGYLVEQESINQLALKMEAAIDKSAHFKQNCIDSIQEYSTEKVNQKIVDLYKKVLNNRFNN